MIHLPHTRLIAKIRPRKCLVCSEVIHHDPVSTAWVNTSTGTVDLCTVHNESEY